jgi:hypothetical protein
MGLERGHAPEQRFLVLEYGAPQRIVSTTPGTAACMRLRSSFRIGLAKPGAFAM